MVEALREISVPVAEKQTAIKAEEPSPSTEKIQEKKVDALPTLPPLTTVTETGPDTTAPLSAESRSESRASTNTSEDFSAPSSRHEGSEAGMETEEDEGMVLVGRPAP